MFFSGTSFLLLQEEEIYFVSDDWDSWSSQNIYPYAKLQCDTSINAVNLLLKYVYVKPF
jgi:hypothetical protein